MNTHENLYRVRELESKKQWADSPEWFRTLQARAGVDVFIPVRDVRQAPEGERICDRRSTEVGREQDCEGEVIHRADHWIAYLPCCPGCARLK